MMVINDQEQTELGVLQPAAVVRFGEVEPEDKRVPLAPAIESVMRACKL